MFSRLIEVNARFHAQHFYPLARTCLGYDALTATMDSYFDPRKYSALKHHNVRTIVHQFLFLDFYQYQKLQREVGLLGYSK